MKPLKTILITALLFSMPLVFSYCKRQHKYPEDPRTTTKTPKKRLTGDWKITDYTLNGISILDTLNKISKSNIKECEMTYVEGPGRGQWSFQWDGYFQTYTSLNAFDNFLYIQLNPFRDTVFNKLFITPLKYIPNSSARWTVTKLYGNELRLTLQQDAYEYKIFFTENEYKKP